MDEAEEVVMSTCAKCGGYFSTTKQTMYCPECERVNATNISNCDIPMPQGFGEQKGWICPVCGRGVAPWVDMCPCQNNWKITYGTSTDGTYDIKEYLKQIGQYNTKQNEYLLESDVN